MASPLSLATKTSAESEHTAPAVLVQSSSSFKSESSAVVTGVGAAKVCSTCGPTVEEAEVAAHFMPVTVSGEALAVTWRTGDTPTDALRETVPPAN